MKTRVILLMAVVLLAALGPPAGADRGHFIIPEERLTPNINIHESGQKAIIAWNGTEEIMILSTDLSSDKPVKVLEFMPLPAKPTMVKLRTTTPFEVIQQLIDSHAPVVPAPGPMGRSAGDNASKAPAPVEVVFQQKIGPHEITVARTENMEAFVGWIRKFLSGRNLKYREEFFTRLRPVVQSYLDDRIYYYVFDVVELSKETKSIEPILYRFPTSRLYYPLRVSTLGTGRTHIDLFLISHLKLDIWGSATGFWSGFYRGSTDVPIKFTLGNSDLKRIDPLISELFYARDDISTRPMYSAPRNPNLEEPHAGSEDIWLTTASYRGLVSGLVRDFYAGRAR